MRRKKHTLKTTVSLDVDWLCIADNLQYPDENSHEIIDKFHNVINKEISKKAKEIIVILTTSNNGKKKEIRFLCDGEETKSSDVSEHLKGDRLFPAICLYWKDQQVTTITIDQIKIRTPEIEELIKESQEQNNNINKNNRKNNLDSNQSAGDAVASAASNQLQKELDEALQKVAALSSQLQQTKILLQQEKQQHETEKKKSKEKDEQLQQEKQKSSDLEKKVQQLEQQLSSSSNQNQGPVSPFVADKPYQIDLAKNGVKPPSDPNAFGAILPALRRRRRSSSKRSGSSAQESGFILETESTCHLHAGHAALSRIE